MSDSNKKLTEEDRKKKIATVMLDVLPYNRNWSPQDIKDFAKMVVDYRDH